MSRFLIRRARLEDSVDIARLAGQLGYPASEASMRARLERILGSSNDVVFIAADSGGALLGWVHGFLSQLLESDRRVEIGGLVVDERFHRKGIGRQLIRRIEDWAGEHSVLQISVRCRQSRTEANAFYESLGFRAAKTQVAFRKTIDGAGLTARKKQ